MKTCYVFALLFIGLLVSSCHKKVCVECNEIGARGEVLYTATACDDSETDATKAAYTQCEQDTSSNGIIQCQRKD
jgi:hypothetical protein